MKAQGLSLTAIIVAALALIVLVVLAAIFTGRIGGFGRTVATCESKGGTCKLDAGSTCDPNLEATFPGDTVSAANGNKCIVCCVPFSK